MLLHQAVVEFSLTGTILQVGRKVEAFTQRRVSTLVSNRDFFYCRHDIASRSEGRRRDLFDMVFVQAEARRFHPTRSPLWHHALKLFHPDILHELLERNQFFHRPITATL